MLEQETDMSQTKEEEQTPEKNDLTPYRAQRIFENKVINTINEELDPEDKITSLNEARLKWLVDEQTPAGRFTIIKRDGQKEPAAAEPKTYVKEKDTETGEEYLVEKMTGPVEPRGQKVTAYDLDINEVKKIFNELDPAVKQLFINGWQESLVENKALAEKWTKALKNEMRRDEQEELEAKITEQELAQEKIEKMLTALR